MKQYNVKLQQACATNRLTYKNKQMLLQDVPSAEKILSTNPISVDNFNLVCLAEVERKRGRKKFYLCN